MATYFCRTRTGLACNKAGGKHARYISGEDKFADKTEVKAVIDKNLPKWAKDGIDFFDKADTLERANGRSYRSLIIAIPTEAKDRTQWARDYVDDLLKDQHAYRLAIHDDGKGNPHAHLIFCERGRKAETSDDPKDYFTRKNGKDAALKSKTWLADTKSLYLKHVQKAAPSYTWTPAKATGEQKIGPKLKHAGPTYETQRAQREAEVLELRGVQEDLQLLKKQETEIAGMLARDEQAKAAKNTTEAAKTAVEPTKPAEVTKHSPKSENAQSAAKNKADSTTPVAQQTAQPIKWATLEKEMPNMAVFLKLSMETANNPTSKAMAHAMAVGMSSIATSEAARKYTEEKFKSFQREYADNARRTGGSMEGRSEYAFKATCQHLKEVGERQQREAQQRQQAAQRPPAPRPALRPRGFEMER
jgi:hypothetical protein